METEPWPLTALIIGVDTSPVCHGARHAPMCMRTASLPAVLQYLIPPRNIEGLSVIADMAGFMLI